MWVEPRRDRESQIRRDEEPLIVTTEKNELKPESAHFELSDIVVEGSW